MMIEATNTRRFQTEEGTVLAIVDHCRAYTTYGTVCAAADGSLVFGDIRPYFPDEVEEIL